MGGDDVDVFGVIYWVVVVYCDDYVVVFVVIEFGVEYYFVDLGVG